MHRKEAGKKPKGHSRKSKSYKRLCNVYTVGSLRRLFGKDACEKIPNIFSVPVGTLF
jgi:hypothetical protein